MLPSAFGIAVQVQQRPLLGLFVVKGRQGLLAVALELPISLQCLMTPRLQCNANDTICLPSTVACI